MKLQKTTPQIGCKIHMYLFTNAEIHKIFDFLDKQIGKWSF